MKLGLGLYRHTLKREYYDFARQAGCTHVIAHLVDYFHHGDTNPRDNQPTGDQYEPWGVAGDPSRLWTVEEMKALRREIEAAGLTLAGIENLDPAHWHDILLDGPQRARHIENVKTIVCNMGEAQIPVLGYNFSLAGVCGRVRRPIGRGGATVLGMDGPADKPLPNGMVWNMVYDTNAPAGDLAPVPREAMWDRLSRFLEEVVRVAERAGVTLAAHPDDPPLPTVRQQPRLIHQPDLYQRLIDAVPSANNALEFCVGTLAEMTEGDIYEVVDRYSRQGKVCYVHLRNVTGKAPHYHETFIDDGDVDMSRVIAILQRNRFDGVIIPDHTPTMSCSAPWHSGMAHTLGFIAGVLATLQRQSTADVIELSAPSSTGGKSSDRRGDTYV